MTHEIQSTEVNAVWMTMSVSLTICERQGASRRYLRPAIG